MKILCKLPNASNLINGIQFIEHKLGMVSEEIAEEVAAHFLKIEGYLEFPSAKKAVASAPTPQTPPSTPVSLTVTSEAPQAPAADAMTSDSTTAPETGSQTSSESTGDAGASK